MSATKIATAAPYAAMLAPPSTKLLQAYRKPGTSPKAARRYTYSPPASGSSAPSSAKHRAPSMATTPAATHAASTSTGVPTAWAKAAVDPEEALVAALSSCHMLWFLSLAAGGGWRVDDYSDDALGVLGRNAAGRTAMVRVTLRPRVAFSGERLPARADILQLHHR